MATATFGTGRDSLRKDDENEHTAMQQPAVTVNKDTIPGSAILRSTLRMTKQQQKDKGNNKKEQNKGNNNKITNKKIGGHAKFVRH
jgi:hypothetical protein